MALTDEQVERYARHLILKGVGVKGQKRLLASSVLIIGAGGLGSPAALYLAAAGVGHIGLVDGDVVDMSNLQRQIIHTTACLLYTSGRSQRIHARLHTDSRPHVPRYPRHRVRPHDGQGQDTER